VRAPGGLAGPALRSAHLLIASRCHAQTLNFVLLLGHMGFGDLLARPLAGRLERRWVLLGTLVPDLLDKALYYALRLGTGRVGADLGLVSGTRTFGHTGLFLVLLALTALLCRSRTLLALALGVATHVPLDIGLDLLSGRTASSALLAFVFPLRGLRFAVMAFRSPLEHLRAVLDPAHLVTEAIGLGLLICSRPPRGRRAISGPDRTHLQRSS
jgi:hypothetical protein